MVLAHDITQGHRTQDVKISEDVTFDTMLLALNTLKGMKKSGFYKPSPIQLHGIPIGKCGFDLMLEAKSGTGKTAVFTVIALEKLDLRKGLQVVILAPTREIAAQICDVITQIGAFYEGLNVEVVMGGLPMQEDIFKFKKHVHIVVGSPGRLRHLIQDNYIDISAVRLLVLDEADKLMEKSFQSDINYIFSILPKQKQVIMSSATYPDVSKSFINKYVNNAQYICPDSNSVLLGITQKITIIKYNSNIVRQTQHRFEELLKILSKKQFKQCLIFCNYQARVGELHKMLTREKWPAEKLYGKQEQSHRLDALKTLQEYKCRILISTDLAARGIDASNVDLVINFEPPFEWQTYLHRIGRAGRFGAYGIAITMLTKGKEEIKFNEVMGSIHISFDFRHLWNDNKYYIQSSSKIIEVTERSQNLRGNKTSEDLWSLLTCKSCDNLDSIKEILNFDKLCESFVNSTEHNVESFSDLLCSFQNHDESISKSILYQYKNLNVNEININEYFNSIPNYKSILKTNILCNLSEIQSEIKKIKSEGFGHCNIATGMQKTDELKINIINNSFPPSLSENRSVNEIKELNIHTLNQNSIDDALQAAGLPTCFSSTKNKHKTKNYTNLTVSENDFKKRPSDHYNNENKLLDEKVETKNVRKNGGFSESKRCTMRNKEAIKSVADIEKYSTVSGQYNRQFNIGYNECSYKTKTDSQQHCRKIDDEKCKIDTHKHKQTKIETDYFMWYNQLKNHIKGIEFAMYIDEISKL